MTTILQISDTHLSPRNELFRANLARIATWAEEARPDLIVVTGDLSLDGADHDEDLGFAIEQLRALPAPVLSLPGNHDVGSHAATMPHQPVNADRLARFRRIVGPDRWIRDLPGWRLIGLNTEIMGTGVPDEAEQAAFAADAAASAAGSRIALFLHKPAFVTAPEDPRFDYWSVPPHARDALAPILDHPALRLVASGHLHLHHTQLRDGVRFAWAPAMSFVVEPEEQPCLPGARLCGALVHRLGSDHVETDLIAPPRMDVPWLEAIRTHTYPRQSSAAA